MAQPSVAREPSMDEILASIRRIIESNETGPLSSSEEDMSSSSGFPFGEAANDYRSSDPDDAELIAELRAEERRPVYETVSDRAPAVQPPAQSLADVAARVRAASERNSGIREIEPREPEQENPLVTARMAPRPAAQLRAVEAPEPMPEAPAVVRQVPIEEELAAIEAQIPAVSAEMREEERPSSGLVSAAVSERVAQSFGALAEAMDAGPRRSFDEIAEEMLRPMLRDWLDDNLPTLVERLVREEIERVARGPRR
ncbi:MAG: DUF2497 domain-containing protein [Shinella sp.]|nr:DUF2497 domain-containing protein [Shinella sp.]